MAIKFLLLSFSPCGGVDSEMLTLWRKLQRARKSEVFCVSSRTAWAQVSWCAHPDQVSTLFQPWLTLRLHRLGVVKASYRFRTTWCENSLLVQYFVRIFHSMIAHFCSLLKVLSSRLSSTLSFLHSELVHHFINLVSCWSLLRFVTAMSTCKHSWSSYSVLTGKGQ